MTADNVNRIEAFDKLPKPDRDYLQAHCQSLQLPAGKTVFSPDMEAAHFLILVRGSVKVSQTGVNGRNIVLYRIGGGETCILTTSCLLSGEHYNAEAITETDVTALLLPATFFNELLSQSTAFRQFVFSNYATRIASLIHLVEEVTFERIDVRLAQKLLDLSTDTNHIAITHQNLATELGSVREVISRHLKEFNRRGWIELTRGEIKILDRQALVTLAS